MKKPPESAIPFLTHNLDEMEVAALKEAQPLANVHEEDKDLFQWLVDAVETNELKFKPLERQVRSKSLEVLANRLYKHGKRLKVVGPYDVLRDLADRARKLEEGGIVELEDLEREALQKAIDKGPIGEDSDYEDDKKIPWLGEVVEKGKLKVPKASREKAARKARRKVIEDLRTVAYRLYDKKEMEARETRYKQARCLVKLSEEVSKKSVILETDLRSVNRESDQVECRVYISTDEDNHPRGDMKKWLVLGQVGLRLDLNPTRLQAYLPEGVTDFEHDSAWAMLLPLIGVKLESLRYHTTVIEAYVAPRALDEFCVPWPGYNPMEEEGAETCEYERCKDDPHMMVGEDRYTPYSDPTLYEAVEGRLVRIHIGPRRKGEEDGSA